jgi:hypothetical protein
MTPVYPENTEVTVTVDLPANATLSAVTRTVLDETGVGISPSQPVSLPAPGDVTIDITISANLNVSPGRRAARVVQVSFATDKGIFTSQVIYVIAKPDQLIPLENTFVSSAEAALTRLDMPALDGWDASDETNRNAALITAHRSLCKLSYRYKNNAAILQSRVTWGEPESSGYIYIVDIESLAAEEWAQVPILVRQALQRAQMAEADVLLKGDPVGDKRRAGIVSETVGESSMFLKQTPEVRMGVSAEALEHLAGYIFRQTRIARA